ncbi:glycosyltransferase family protein [Flammeovirga aprica]|uniref:Glycosyltransferase family 4 protein n=1 Tax=Flammeovirga aprica JL-4 TaxID=694437 RepID=A0A7X9RRB0_9BACT|nr:hypothetical protein [Flammeovirga aprica]NME67668.1 glycosyltransferase family 4 protein [Flammeovirga aprica JL-4]
MKILLVSYFFYPENSPRAFRAYELIEEFVERGYSIDLILPNKKIFYSNIYKRKNVNVILIGDLIEEKNSSNVNHNLLSIKINEYLRKVINYFYPFFYFKNFINSLSLYLSNLNRGYDIIFSNSFPFAVHYGLYKGLKKNKKLNKSKLKIAEYSDPFFFQSYIKINPIYKYLEKMVLKEFDYIFIPTDKAITSYTYYKKQSNIKVFPQAFNFEKITTKKYSGNSIPTFAYAGLFYSGMRDPSSFFEYLCQREEDFKFIIFSRELNDKFIERYKKKLGSKLIVHVNVPRLELIEKLSEMDFLININNISSNQVPSKLIDYSLSGRPILSISQQFDPEIFENFCHKDYSQQEEICLDDYRIQNNVNRLIRLYNEHTKN